MNVPGSYPRSKMISELGVMSEGSFISMESKSKMAKMELKTITAAAHPYNNSARFLVLLNQTRNLQVSVAIRAIVSA